VPGTVLGDVIALLGFIWPLSLSTWGANVDVLACPLHRPTVCGRQMRGQSFLSGAAPSHRAIVGGGTFLGSAKPPSLDI
jgi:hypothetical protein